MTSTGSTGVDAKFRRARQHLAELERQVQEYFAAEPFTVYTEAEPTSGPEIYRVHVATPPPVDLALVVGDVIHNARSALDHVACRLVEANGGSTAHTKFPTGSTRSEFSKAVKAGLKGANEDAKAAVRELEVYDGGDNRLWRLHRLDIEDKHKLLIPVGMSYRTVNLHIGHGDLQLEPLGIVPAHPLFPITEGAELLCIQEQPRFAPTGGFTQNYSFTFDLALDPSAMGADRPTPVVEAVADLVNHAESVAVQLLAGR